MPKKNKKPNIMTTLKVILMSLTASLGLIKQQVVRTFGRETSIVDKEAVDVILSNSNNKEKLIKMEDEENER